MFGLLSTTREYRWGIVCADEPPGVRMLRGFVTILVRQTEGDTSPSYRVLYQDAEGRPYQSLTIEDVDVFYDATQAALVEMGLRSVPVDRPIAGDIIR